MCRSEYSEGGDTSFELTDSNTSDLSEPAAPEQFWRESESPPKTRYSPPPARRASLTPKFSKALPGHAVSTSGHSTDDLPATECGEGRSGHDDTLGHTYDQGTKSELESVRNLSLDEEEMSRDPPNVREVERNHHRRAFTQPVYLPSRNPRTSVYRNPRNILFGLGGGGETRAVMNNTLSFKLDNSKHQVNIRQSINQSINQSVSQSINQSINQSNNQSII